MKKRIISAVLSGLMLASAVIAPASAVGMPSDVTSDKWYYDAVKFAYENGIMEGVTPVSFNPDGSLTRAQFVTILCRMSGGKETITDKFTDVTSEKWYAGFVGWAETCGVVNGVTPTTFAPDNYMTRQEMAAAMVRYINYREINLPRENNVPYVFGDDEQIADWAESYVNTLRISGITKGDDSVCYNPESSITRAETATIIQRLYGVIDKAWQGYTPDASDGYAVFGAKYLYWGGTMVQGGLGTDLVNAGDDGYPSLSATPDPTAARRSYDPADTIGISTLAAGVDVRETPVVKVCYSYEKPNEISGPLTGLYNVNNVNGPRYMTEPITFTDGAEDAGWKTATVNISDIVAKSETHYDVDFPRVLIKHSAEDNKLLIRYVGFFKSQSEADAFDSSKHDDYLKNYFVYSDINYTALTDSLKSELDQTLVDRIEEIMNSESAVTPEDIEAAGGKCWYVSSLNGDDSNDGSSPEKAFKTIDQGLYEYKKGPGIYVKKVKPGDGVFFERGSKFYAKRYNQNSVTCLNAEKGVTYGAYGKGDKPMFSCAIDIEGNGYTWQKTNYKNIWQLSGFDPNPDFCGKRCEVGNIAFNDGQYVGLHIYAEDPEHPLGEGKKTKYTGYLSADGINYVDVGGTSAENIGTALQHNFEFLHDWEAGKLYLYWDGENPGKAFDDILISRKGYAISADSDVTLDNLAIKSSTTWCASIGHDNVKITNCEVAFSGNGVDSIASGIETYGDANGTYISNCYIHDIEDGPLTNQCASNEEGDPVYLQNIEYANNVIVAGGNGAEIWNHMGPIDENGYAQNRIRNVRVHDNIMAYIGYGIKQQEKDSPNSVGDVLCASMYGEFENCVFDNNTIMYPAGSMVSAYIATDTQPRGWQMRDNTYVINPAYTEFKFGYETINYLNHNMNKRVRMSSPFDLRYMTFYTSNGVDPTGKYYEYTDITPEQEKRSFFMTGWHVYHK